MKQSAFLKNILSCPKKTAIYKRINPVLFDVSLRDGIQNAIIENFPTDRKMSIFHSIITELKPQKIEIGSLCSPRVLPIMKDSLVLHNFVKQYFIMQQRSAAIQNIDVYVLIPSMNKLYTAIEHNIKNFSFITSLSEQFQIRNTNKTIQETKSDFDIMFARWFREPCNYKTKLYISCFNACPILGKLDNDFILKEILYYNEKYNFDELCLSDTMGSLTIDDFEYIIENCLFFGIPPSKLSFHFHCMKGNQENLEKILYYCFYKKLTKFDISMLETGGCSVTMVPSKLRPNMTYDMFYFILDKYITRYIQLEEIYGEDCCKKLSDSGNY